MSAIIKTPTISANEDAVTLTEWLKPAGSAVRRGEPVCTVETTKANIEIEAEVDGFLHPVAQIGARVAVGAPLAVLTDRAEDDPAALLAMAGGGVAPERRWTKKAAITARRLGIDLAALAARSPGKVLGEEDVLAAQAAHVTPSTAAPPPVAVASAPAGRPEDLLEDRYGEDRPERILLLGGGAGAGVITLDALARLPRQRAVGILDRNPNTHGKTVAGVPVLGPVERAAELWKAGLCDSVIILFTDSNEERAALFERLRAEGVPFANVIDPSVERRSHVRLGQGNLIMANCFLAACATLGDNNFLASHTCIEHHAVVGSHCTFGPRTTTAGAVKIGDRVKTGMAVAIEPYVSIGSDSLIASGCVITRDVPAGSAVKAQQGYTVRPRQSQAAE
ncbi:MAG TPA: biotin/lipoyl-containing protein [Alphaproteobacteria bacterium]|nr:biotin/lipoyl-containing protein [Alphaproteobacteria bacterium]